MTVGQKILFGRDHFGIKLLSYGWSNPEDWGTWSDGKSAKLDIRVSEKFEKFTIYLGALIEPDYPKQTVKLEVNGVYIQESVLTNRGENLIEVSLPSHLQEKIHSDKRLQIDFSLPDAISPAEIGLNEDSRELAIGLISLELN